MMAGMNAWPTLVLLVSEAPEDKDVTAGWIAFVIFVLLGVAVAVLGWSLTKQLRKAQSAKDAGVYGDKPGSDAPGS
jgi:hypothetical protein